MKILIIKIGAVGDTVMALSMLEAIDRFHPGAEITWVCGGSVAPLVRSFPRVQKVLVVDDRRLLRGGLVGGALELLSLWAKILGRGYDLILTGHSDARYRLLSLPARGKVRRAFGTGGWGPLPGRYHADEYVRLVTGLDGPQRVPAIFPHWKPSPREALGQELAGRKGSWVALAPGGAKNILRDDALRRWPIGHYVRLAELLLKEGKEVLLTGGPSDDWVRGYFKDLKVRDLVGRTDLTDLVALYGQCQVVVTHDSGPMHLAALAGTPVVGLFGPTRPDEKVPPDGPIHVLWGGEHLTCRPCYDGKNYADCLNNECMKSIEPERVLQEVQAILAGK